jgi:hypothetical protein
MPLTTRIVLFALLAITIATGRAHAQSGDEDARHHFRIGEAHYQSGHFLEAAREFERAYELSGRAALLHNVYVAYRDAGDTHNAARALRHYLDTADHIENETLLRQRLAVLERSISDGDTPPPPEGGDRTTSESSGSGPSPVGFAVGGIGLAIAIGGAITGGLAMATRSELESMCPNDLCPADYDFASRANTGQALAIATDVLIPVGAAALVTGVILLFVLSDGSESSTNAGGICTGEGCMAFVRTRF